MFEDEDFTDKEKRVAGYIGVFIAIVGLQLSNNVWTAVGAVLSFLGGVAAGHAEAEVGGGL